MIARTSFSIAATRYCCLQILSAGRREWCQGHCVVGLLLITALMRSLGRAVGVAGGAGDVGLAVAAVVSDGGVAQHGGDGGAVAGAGLVSVLAEGDVAGADLTPLPQIVTALHRARPAPTIEDDMDNLAPEAPEAPEAATVTAASFGVEANRHLRLPDLPASGVGLVGPGAAACSPPSCPPVGRGHPATKPPSPPPRPTSPPSSDPTQPTATNSTASTSPTASTTP